LDVGAAARRLTPITNAKGDAVANTPNTRVEQGPTLVVAACIVHSESVLLARRNQPSMPQIHGHWELPGGKVQFGETPHQTIQREIVEELGLRVHLVRLLPHVQSNIYRRPDNSVAHFVVLCFECVPDRGGRATVAEHSAVLGWRWVARSQVKELETLPGTTEFLACLDRIEPASEERGDFFVSLRREHRLAPQRWMFLGAHDLFGHFSVEERRVDLHTRSTKRRIVHASSPEQAQRRVTARIRNLARYGYVVSESTSPFFGPLN